MTASASHARRSVVPAHTASGEPAIDRYSRRANALEAAAVYLLVQAALWSGIGHPPGGARPSWVQAAGLAIVVITLGYTTAIAPWLHGDSRADRGLAASGEFQRAWGTSRLGARAGMLLVCAGLPMLLAWAGWDTLLSRLGVRATWPSLYQELTGPWWRAVGSGTTALLLAAGLALLLVRWSTVRSTLRTAAFPVGLLLVGVVAGAALLAQHTGDWSHFAQFSWVGRGGFLRQFAAYVPWALLQQWVLLGYLNTRLRKGIAPTGVLGIPAPIVATLLTALAFGAMHAPNLPLALLTAVGGAVSGWLFLRDRSRNLLLIALAHALAGTLLATLTSVPMTVGPRV